MTANDRASYVSSVMVASLEPGGPLHNKLSDFLAAVELVAMDTAGVPYAENEVDRVGWPGDFDKDVDRIAGEIVDLTFKTALAYFAAAEHPDSPRADGDAGGLSARKVRIVQALA